MQASLTAPEAARLLHVGRNKVYELAKSRELGSYRIGRKLRFARHDIDEYLARQHRMADAHYAADDRRLIDAHHTTDARNTTGARYATNDQLVADACVANDHHLVDTRHVASACYASNTPLDLSVFKAPQHAELPPATIAGDNLVCDILANHIASSGFPATQHRINAYGALIELYTSTANIAVIDLYDLRSNSYNTPYVQRLAPGTPCVIIRLLERTRGFIVQAHNPKNIHTWGSLLKEGVHIVNRPYGSAARVLLDEKLLALEARPETITGYSEIIYSEEEAAQLVADGYCDMTVGLERTAQLTRGVQFIPMQREHVDIVVRKSEANRPLVRAIKKLVRSDAFLESIPATVGAKTEHTGAITYEC